MDSQLIEHRKPGLQIYHWIGRGISNKLPGVRTFRLFSDRNYVQLLIAKHQQKYWSFACLPSCFYQVVLRIKFTEVRTTDNEWKLFL